MSYLTQRAEQALLGAMLADEVPIEQLAGIDASSFGEREHRKLFTDITGIRRGAPTLRGEALINTVAHRSTDYGIDRRHLAYLRIDCPNPAHILGYARLVHAGAFRRHIAARADELAAEIARTPSSGRTQYASRLAEALGAQARNHEPITRSEPGRIRRALGMASVPQPGATVDVRANREDTLLADLLQSPRQADWLARYLPAETFHDPQRREVYQTILHLAMHREPVDEVMVAWTMASQRAVAAGTYDAPIDQRPIPAEPDVVYLDRLSRTLTTISAVESARSLLAEDIRKNQPWTGPVSQALNPHENPHRPAMRPAGPPADPALHRPQPTHHPGPAPQPGR